MSFPETLKTWRQARRFSQLDLALEADVSARHVSFLETGRARPSADMVARLGAALNLPLDARNQMLVAAGFAARYPARDWSDDTMAPVRQAVAHTLASHMPYPALAVDRLWTIVDLNPAAATLFGAVGLGVGGSILEAMCGPVLPEVVENWPEVARHAAERLRLESAALGGDEALDRAASYLGVVSGGGAQTPLGPVIPTILRLGETRLSLFATIAQFGTAQDLALADLKIELYFPADEETETMLRGQTSS